MFSKAGIIELHSAMHERLDLLLRHIATVPDNVHHNLIPGLGHPSIWKQRVHILTCEEGWVHDLQNKAFPGWHDEDCPTMAALLATKDRIREATRTYLGGLTEEQLNTDTSQASRGLGRRTPKSCLYPAPRHNPRISPQRPSRRDAANPRYPA